MICDHCQGTGLVEALTVSWTCCGRSDPCCNVPTEVHTVTPYGAVCDRCGGTGEDDPDEQDEGPRWAP